LDCKAKRRADAIEVGTISHHSFVVSGRDYPLIRAYGVSVCATHQRDVADRAELDRNDGCDSRI
jgi:hypothetical protein